METILLVAAWLFALTHLDTLVVLVAFCADTDYRLPEVMVGHYVGFSIGLAGAVVAAVIAAEFLQAWTFLLGLVPLGMGVWGLVRRHPEMEIEDIESIPDPAGRVGIVTAAGIGLSGENMAVFIPFFAGLSTVELGIVVVTYLVGAGVVFLVALVLTRRTALAELPDWVERRLLPVVLLLVGAYVLVSGWVV